MNNHYDLNDLGPSWELMKQDLPGYRILKPGPYKPWCEEHHQAPPCTICDYESLDELRAKLTSWPALFSKRYEVARALALGWWYKHAAKDRATITENVIFGAFCLFVVVCAFWLASR